MAEIFTLDLLVCLALIGCGRGDPSDATSAPKHTQVLLSDAEASPAASGIGTTQAVSDTKLPVYELKIAPAHLQALQMNAFANMTYPATFIAGGKRFEGVKVRARGSWSRSWPKKSLKILFDHQQPFDGQTSLNLNSGWRDPAFIREVIAYRVYAACGVPASKSRVVRLNINGQFGGLYVEVEQPGKEFLNRVNLKGATVYKAASRSRDADERDLGDDQAYKGAYTKQTKKTEGYDDLEQFCHGLAEASDVLAYFQQHVELDEYINYLAATALLQNWDTFNKNHYLVYNARGSGKWLVVPWDLDRTLGDHWNQTFGEAHFPVLLGTHRSPGVTGWNRLEDRFFSVPSLRLRFLDRLSELLDREFTAEKLFPVLDNLETQIGPEAKLDRQRWPGPRTDLHNAIASIKSYIERRRAFLKSEIPRLRESE